MSEELELLARPGCAPITTSVADMRVGPYRLCRLIDSDATATLYRGERCDGLFEQVVAIKLLRAGATSGLERFENERRTLARLQHTNIAQLLDGGMSEDGAPYIVMEYLQSVPVIRFASERALGTRERIALLRSACLAVQYAHQNLIAHGDIGPTNVRVTRAGVVKLLDFGLGALRAQHEGANVTRDIEALGDLMEQLLGAHLDTDLRAIISKAARVECAQRYGSVTELIEDLERYLGARPVRARQPTWRYLAHRTMTRHRWLVLGASAAVAALILGGIVAMLLYLRAERLTREATTRFDDVRHLANFMLFDLYDMMGRVPGSVDVRRELADRSRTYLATLASIPGAPADIELEAAQGHARLGEVLGSPGSFNLGQTRAAKHSLSVAQGMLEALRLREPARNEVAIALARVLLLEASILSSMDFDATQAGAHALRARQLCDEVLGRDPHDVAAMLLRWKSQNTLGDTLGWQNRMPEVVKLMRTQLAIASAIPRADHYTVERTLLEASSRNMLGDALYYTQDLKGSLGAYRQAAALIETERHLQSESAHPQADDPRYLEELGLIYWNEGGLLSELNRDAEADQALTRATTMMERSIDYGSNERTERLLQSVRLQHALVLSSRGAHARAIALGLASVTNREQRLAKLPGDRQRHRDLAVGLRPLGDIYLSAHQPTAACASYQRAQQIWLVIDRGWGIEAFDREKEFKLLSERLAGCAH